MANDRQDEYTEGSRYGPISTRTQATQTLPVQTQPPTQLMSHEMHQYTQLVHHDLTQHVGGDTLINDSDAEGSGDTVVLNDDGGLHGVGDMVPIEKGPMSKPVENLHSCALHVYRDLPDSDATTEEGDAGDAGYLDADAESRPSQIAAPPDDEGGKIGDNLPAFIRSSLPEVAGASENVIQQDTPQVAVVATTNASKDSQSKPRSISSVRAASLRASGLRAAGRSASLNSSGKEGVKFDSESTIDLTPGTLDDGLKGLEAGSHGIDDVHKTTTAEFDSRQSSPKVTMLFEDAVACMSTSRSKSKSASSTHASLEHAFGFTDEAPVEQGIKDRIDSDSPLMTEKPKSDAEQTSAPLEPVSLGLKRLRSQASIINGSDARPDAELKLQTGPPSSQKARKLVFDYMETSTDKLGGGRNIGSKGLNTDHGSSLRKQTSGVHAPARQVSVPSGVRAGSANLSYLESQDPGEESQMNALNVVDKLVWLDASCMPDDAATTHVHQDGSVKCHAGIKGLQSLALAAQMKVVHDKLDVFDWEDSQIDEEASSDKKPVPVNVRGRKRQVEAPKLTMSSKKQVVSHTQKTQPIPHRGIQDQKSALVVGKPEVANLGSNRLQDKEVTPHTVLTTRLRNRTKAGSSLSSKGRKSPGLPRGRRKRDDVKKPATQVSKEHETEQQRTENNIKTKVQQPAPESRRRAGRKKLIDGSGRDPKLEQKKQRVNQEGKQKANKTSEIDTNPPSVGLADRTSEDDAAADIWIEAFSKAKNKTPVGSDVELIKFKKRSALRDESEQDFKKCKTMEPSLVTRDKKYPDTCEQEEVFKEKDRVRSGSKSESDLKKYNITNLSSVDQRISRRTDPRLMKVAQQNKVKGMSKVDTHSLEKESVDKEANVRQNSKESKISDARRLKDSSHVEHQDALEKEWNLLEKDEADRVFKKEQDAKHNETADSIQKSRKVTPQSTEMEHVSSVQQDQTAENPVLERGPNTRSQAQDTRFFSSSSHGTATKKLRTSLLGEASKADSGVEKPSTKADKSRKKSHQHSSTSAEEAPARVSTRSTRGRVVADIGVLESAKAGEEAPAQGPKRSKKRRDATDANVSESAKAREDAISQPGEQSTSKFSQHIEELRSQEGDRSGALRRTRSSTTEDGLKRHEPVNMKESQVKGNLTSEEQSLTDQVWKSTTRLSEPLSRQNKKTKALKALEKLSSSSVVDEGRRRKREAGEICVLFSHSLTEETIKHQKKILAKLGGRTASSALECTHFISNVFVRSQNMLISMAAGKIVATTLWLESCGQAHYFVDEKNYVLHDEKKEKEFGFSMITSLAAARRKPLFKDVKVVICANTIPEPTALRAIVESSGGQVMDARTCLSQSDIKDDKTFIVVANGKGLETCSQFLVKGLEVYSEELILQGVVTQALDFSRNRLFEDYRQQRGSRRM